MANEVIQARVSPELKAEAEAVFAAMGLKTSEAIRLFLQQSVNVGGLPFQPHAKRPNAETLAAMRDAEEGRMERFDSLEDFLSDLYSDDDGDA